MPFEGRIMRMLPQRNGTSQRTGNDWVAQPFVFEFHETDISIYSNKILLETYNTDLISKMQENMKCRCEFYHRINEYNGRLYNEIRLHKLELIVDATQPQITPQEAPKEDVPTDTPQPTKEATQADDLPF